MAAFAPVELAAAQGQVAKRPRMSLSLGAGCRGLGVPATKQATPFAVAVGRTNAAMRCGKSREAARVFAEAMEAEESAVEEERRRQESEFIVPAELKERSPDITLVSATSRSSSRVDNSTVLTSSSFFENYRGSLRARHAPLAAQYAVLLAGERGLPSRADYGTETLGLSCIADIVEAMVQLADLKLDVTANAEKGGGYVSCDLLEPALELFEKLCTAVSALQKSSPGISSIPPDVYLEEMRRRWSSTGQASCTSDWEASAARVAALFRMKDAICSLYAWGLLPLASARELLGVIVEAQGIPGPLRLLIADPVAGTGLHAAVFEAALRPGSPSRGSSWPTEKFSGLHLEVMLADSVDGGSTQSSGADTQYLSQCSIAAPALHDGFGRVDALGVPPVETALRGKRTPLVWRVAQRLNVFDRGDKVEVWWRRLAVGNSKEIEANEDGQIPVLFLSFPPPPPSTVAEVALQRFGGQWLIFVGEWRGCTATAVFFSTLEKEWDIIRTLDLPRWPMMDDRASRHCSDTTPREEEQVADRYEDGQHDSPPQPPGVAREVDFSPASMQAAFFAKDDCGLNSDASSADSDELSDISEDDGFYS